MRWWWGMTVAVSNALKKSLQQICLLIYIYVLKKQWQFKVKKSLWWKKIGMHKSWWVVGLINHVDGTHGSKFSCRGSTFSSNTCCHITPYVEDQLFSTILQVEVGVETGVAFTDRHSLFRHYLNMDVITCNKIQYTVTLKTATTYRFVKLHLWKEFIPRLIL